MYGILRTLGHLDILTFVSCDFPGNVTSRENWLPSKWDFPANEIFALMGIRFHGYLDIMDIRLSRIFGYHGYSDIMDIRTSWIFRYHWYTDIMDILGEHIFPGNLDFPENYTYEALSMQSCMPNFTFEALALQVPGGHFLIFILGFIGRYILAAIPVTYSPNRYGRS